VGDHAKSETGDNCERPTGAINAYQAFFEEASDGMFITDQNRRIVAANRQWSILTGYSPEDLLGIDSATIIDPLDLPRQPPPQAILPEDPATPRERIFLRKDGSRLQGEIRQRLLADGKLLSLVRDISKRKQTEVATEERAMELAALHALGLVVNSSLSLDQVGRAALEGMLAAVQPDLAYLFLRDGDHLILREVVPPEGRDRLGAVPDHKVGECLCGLAVREEIPLYSRNIHTDPRCTWDECKNAGFHSFATLPLRSGPEIIGVIGLASFTDRDFESRAGFLEILAHHVSLALVNARNYESAEQELAERKKTEAALWESESKSRAIFERSPVGILLLDGQSVVLDCNEHFAAIFEVPRERYLGIKLLDHLPAGPIRNNLLRTLDGEGIHRFEDSHISIFSGKQVYLTIVSEKINPDLLIVVMTDISEQKQAALAQEKLQEQLLQAQKMESVGRLAGGVAHDFNNMLTAILGHTELAMRACSPEDAILADLKIIESAAHRSADLVRQLLAFARKQAVNPKVLDLNDCVAGLLKMLVRLIGEDIDLVWKPDYDVWPIKIDPSQIDQILANLCVNARDAIAGVGKITIGTKNISFDDEYCSLNPTIIPGEYVQLSVSDNGSGMEREVLEHIFEPFFTTKELGKGTGLGLSTVYGITKQNQGFVDVASEPGKGTSFKIYLPRFTAMTVPQETEKKEKAPKGCGQLVLLVEDEKVILNVGQAMLEQLGYRVLSASSPGEALQQAKAQTEKIELLITDVIMPEMNGRDLARILVDIIPGLKCLFTSGYTSDIIAHHGVLDEKINFIQKPFSFTELAVKVSEVLGEEDTHPSTNI
jgi:PAS domain S-box-containing protein